MATTLKKLKELSLKTIEAVIKSPEAWKKYLSTTPRTFRYSFEDQILIYAQAPKATAVATYDVWNKLMYRAVKRGSSGIGLIHTKKSYEKIDYVFDVSQTVERSDSRPLYIWKVTADNEATIKSYLQNTISTDEVTDNIPDLLQELIKESTNEVIDDLCDALKEDVTGTYLEGLEDDQLKHDFRELLNDSVYYVCLAKCGYDPDTYLSPDSFRSITNFNNLNVLRHLGYATTEACNEILHGITVNLLRNQKLSKNNSAQEILNTKQTIEPVSDSASVPNFGTKENGDEPKKESDNHIMRTPPLNPVQINDIVEAEDDYTQLEFIPTEDEQTELVQLELSLHENKKNENYILDSEINAILRLGGGEINSQYSIAARLIKDIGKDQFAEFLSEEYKTGGRGVYLLSLIHI